MNPPSILSPAIVLILATTLLSMCIEDSQGDELYNRILSDSDEFMSSAGNANPNTEGKRSWQSLQGSWGKRAEREGGGSASVNSLDLGRAAANNYDDNEYEINLLLNMDQAAIAATSSGLHQLPAQPPMYQMPAMSSLGGVEQKRAWKSMAGAWGKRLGNSDWNKFRGSWGKREPGWNNLKGLWGKRAAPNNWNKLQSAWGKRNEY